MSALSFPRLCAWCWPRTLNCCVASLHDGARPCVVDSQLPCTVRVRPIVIPNAQPATPQPPTLNPPQPATPQPPTPNSPTPQPPNRQTPRPLNPPTPTPAPVHVSGCYRGRYAVLKLDNVQRPQLSLPSHHTVCKQLMTFANSSVIANVWQLLIIFQ